MSEAVDTARPVDRQHWRFLLLYALAAAGGAVSYVPFLTILLPVRVEAMAGGEHVSWLAYCAFAGAIAASLSNIAFGWLSDRTGNRSGWILTGLVLSAFLLPAFALAGDLVALLLLLAAWQVSINMMIAPLAALAGDFVPDRQKGLLGGLLSASPALGAAAGVLVTIPGLADADTRLVLVAGLVALCVLPLLLFARPRHFPELMRPVPAREGPRDPRPRALVTRMWIARLLVQIAEAALFAYLYIWLRSISAEIGDNDAATVFTAVLVLAIPAALVVGRWADARNRPILPLGLCAAVTGLALLAMALAADLPLALAGYGLFGLASSIFLALHSAQTLRVLPRPQHRGRDLGLFNLTNTMPSLVMPGLTLAMVPVFGFAGLFVVLAVLVGVAAILLATVPPPQ
ncbi:MFS transporter [Aurantiacibacter poecillastricola]|uniref:MFS transporter n=1 Tax=Aurantiacibacter poecillastricola TaxID=3064385 RepID=UPI00273F6A33|nr:MFS transporter [Aurantiacibacter sp. 219JJ12-13]MDP5260030.1 MFS transporter [Aurantiacibacter sp. 219JJ12-13]